MPDPTPEQIEEARKLLNQHAYGIDWKRVSIDEALPLLAQVLAARDEMRLKLHNENNALLDRIAELEALIVELEGDLAAWKAATGLSSLTAAEAGDELDRRDDEKDDCIAELEALLREYGWHKPGCVSQPDTVVLSKLRPCDCGWADKEVALDG